MKRVVRDAVRVVVDVVPVGDQCRSVCSKMFGTEDDGARVAEERGVANEVGDARDEVRVLRDKAATIWKPVERPAAVASGVVMESIIVRQRREVSDSRRHERQAGKGERTQHVPDKHASGFRNRDADRTASRGN